MKEQILNALKDKVDALDIIEINDLCGFTTAEELRDLQLEIDALISDNIIFRSKKISIYFIVIVLT